MPTIGTYFYNVAHKNIQTMSEESWQVYIKNKDSLTGSRQDVKSSEAKASKCRLKCSSRMIIFIKLVYLSSLISLKWG